jgi:endonuclease YncB( thermonuclease family)
VVTVADAGWVWPNSRITQLIDGDTVNGLVSRDLGFGGTTSFTVRLRLNRINAPKISTKAGLASMAALANLVITGAPLLTITTSKPYKYGGPDPDKLPSPGEWMAEVVLPDGTNVSDIMVSMKRAVYWDGQGPRPADGH